MREMPVMMASSYHSRTMDEGVGWANAINEAGARRLGHASLQQVQRELPKNEEEQSMTTRIVQVFVADTNDNLPLKNRVLYRGDQHLTDLTDQELFYEISINEILAKHNAERVKTVDKAQSSKFGRDIFLEPAKIRDLKMVVVTVATF